MCFSATASFAVGFPLIPAGLYCMWAAVQKKILWLPLATVPIWFGVQQISEGFVWHALDHGHPDEVRAPSLFFLFFALAFWPFWFPFMGTFMESDRRRRWLFVGMTVLATGWFWVLYFPLLNESDSMLTVRVVHHSVQYDFYDQLWIYHYLPRTALKVLYLGSVALPMALASNSSGRVPGAILAGLALLTALVFEHAFVSVWCFFASILSAYLCYMFFRLPVPTPANSFRVG